MISVMVGEAEAGGDEVEKVGSYNSKISVFSCVNHARNDSRSCPSKPTLLLTVRY